MSRTALLDLPIGAAIGAADLARAIEAARTPDAAFIVGLTGSVAVGKSTLAQALAAALADAAIVTTDGFLFPNAVLQERGILARKGFPESYDVATLRATLQALRDGGADIPGYSHALYDIDPALTRRLDRTSVVIVEGLSLPPGEEPPPSLDALIYLDADEADLEFWFLERFMRLRDAARTDATSFYARFVAMDDAQADAFARQVWAGINLPNLRDHIAPVRDVADIVLRKTREHALVVARG